MSPFASGTWPGPLVNAAPVPPILAAGGRLGPGQCWPLSAECSPFLLQVVGLALANAAPFGELLDHRSFESDHITYYVAK